MSSSPSDIAPIQFSQRWQWGSKQAISFLMQQGADNPEVLSLAAGLVDPATLPCDAVRQIVNDMCQNPGEARGALQYNSSQGTPRLRKALVQHLANLEGRSAEEINLSADQIFLTTGSQQLLSLICEILFNPGDIAFVAAPTYFVFLGTLAGVGAEAIPIRSDDQGMDIDALDVEIEKLAAAGQLHRVKLIYLVSDFENPSGICLSAERRRQVVQLVQKWSRMQRILILEDAAYRELRYSGSPLPSIWSFDTEQQHVLLAQTFSKSFSPGLRVGYGVVPQALIEPLSDRKGNEDFGSAHFNQQVIARAMESGIYSQHVEHVRQAYKIKRDALPFRQSAGLCRL
jgi:2-aminoadipate transaminase